LNNKNLEELSTLTNLEELEFNYCIFDNDGLSAFKNHENLVKLTINNLTGDEKVLPSNIGGIKSLKEIHIEQCYCEESNYDLSNLSHLETLYFETTQKCDLDLSKLDKLTELSIIGPTDIVFGIGIDEPSSLKFPDSLKKLKLTELTFSSDNYKEIASLPNLEELAIVFYGDSVVFTIKSLKCQDNLKKLIIHPSNYSNRSIIENNLDFLNDLKNLEYLDLSIDSISEIPQIKNLKKLNILIFPIIDYLKSQN